MANGNDTERSGTCVLGQFTMKAYLPSNACCVASMVRLYLLRLSKFNEQTG